MKRFLIVALVGVFALGVAGTARASFCALDAVPASTLLFPFVTYDYEQGAIDNSGQTTLLAITNVSSDAQIVHITIWSDYSVAVLDFNIVLTGYDVQTMNIRDILRDGNLPAVADNANIWEEDNEGGAPFDDGPFSTFNELWGGALDGWFITNGLPDPQPTADDDTAGLSAILNCDPEIWDSSPNNYFAIPSGTLTVFKNYLQASQTADTMYGMCDLTDPFNTARNVALDALGDVDEVVDFDGVWFTEQFDRATWMYITADVVGACNKDLPDSATSYFVDPFGTPPPGQTYTNGVQIANVLIGDVIYLNEGENFAEADNAVHLEAFDTIGPTFYSRYHQNALGFLDGREPLPSAWGFRYMQGPTGATAPRTWIRAWKGGTLSAIVEDLNNGSISLGPDEIFANTCTPYTYYAWDEDEQVNRVEGSVVPWSGGPIDEPIPVPNLFPLETQEVESSQFFLVGDPAANRFGWLMFIWPGSNNHDWFTGSTGIDLDMYQTWMGVKYAPFGQYTAGLSGAVLANYNCNGPSQSIPVLGIGVGSYSE